MDIFDDESELSRFADAINRRGHAAVFAQISHDASHRSWTELNVAREWAKALYTLECVEIVSVHSVVSDPPDCLGYLDGREVTIELTEFVNRELLAKIDRYNREAGYRSTSNDMFFDEALWTEEKFTEKLGKEITSKNEKYRSRSLLIDYLILYSGEDWLTPHQIKEWLDRAKFQPTSNIAACYFVRDYIPSYSEHWPIFKVF